MTKQVRTILATPGFPVTLDYHTFRAGKAGTLEHLINDELRATVPAEGFADYAAAWPACKPVLDEIGAPVPAAAPAPKADTAGLAV